jgi:hypothetical protein
MRQVPKAVLDWIERERAKVALMRQQVVFSGFADRETSQAVAMLLEAKAAWRRRVLDPGHKPKGHPRRARLS